MIPVKKFNHGVASYPTAWNSLVISEKKICIRFDAVQLKTRVLRDFRDELKYENYGYAMPVNSHGTDVPFLAVGIPMHLHKEMLSNLLPAYKEHAERFPESSIKEFLLDFADKIKETFDDK